MIKYHRDKGNLYEEQAIDQALLDSLVCPLTGGNLEYDRQNAELISHKAGLAYPVRDGIPVLLVEEARKLATS